MCETPKSPPGDYNEIRRFPTDRPLVVFRVKHLNPRQGITTNSNAADGILSALDLRCETPKSPPGDYNRRRLRHRVAGEQRQRV